MFPNYKINGDFVMIKSKMSLPFGLRMFPCSAWRYRRIFNLSKLTTKTSEFKYVIEWRKQTKMKKRTADLPWSGRRSFVRVHEDLFCKNKKWLPLLSHKQVKFREFFRFWNKISATRASIRKRRRWKDEREN